MPIFQADLEHDRPARHADPSHTTATGHQTRPQSLRRLSEDSLPAELCEGPIPDSPGLQTRPTRDNGTAGLDRVHLIQRLKRAQSPTWPSNRNFEPVRQSESKLTVADTTEPPRSPSAASLLPATRITLEKQRYVRSEETLQDGLSIERPRSALHSGDFTHDEATQSTCSGPLEQKRAEERVIAEHSWSATSPPRSFQPFPLAAQSFGPTTTSGFRSGPSPLSSSLSSSFAYQPPTSPLVQSVSNEEADFPMHSGDVDFTSGNNHLASHRASLHSAHSSPPTSPPHRAFVQYRPALHRRESSLPYQAHQPRRSLSSTPAHNHGVWSPQTPLPRPRPPSFGSDLSPIQHASMVGSYEESILQGRMSTTPSKPFAFMAQIGVLGMGDCKPSLRCPAHVTLPFPAVYYSYSTTAHGRSQSDDGPSPYVGQIDLENGLPNRDEESRSQRKAHARYAERAKPSEAGVMPDSWNGKGHKAPRCQQRSGYPKAPPGGSYRIPEMGQIQIIVKNQNKTALKLFLVPYDLSGMEPGTKTFIRQRSYSAGPIIDNSHTPAAESAPTDRPVLRYLVHLHICCPAKGRYFLYKNMRIVFANRVPDGKEKLRNETTLPEPRFTPYKPVRVMHQLAPPTGGPGATLAAEKVFRRRSLGVSFGALSQALHMPDPAYTPNHSLASYPAGGNTLPVDPIPFRLPPRERAHSGFSDASTAAAASLRSPGSSSPASRPSTKGSAGTGARDATRYEKLSKGEVGYGGNTFGTVSGGIATSTEGLLSQRLRTLGMRSAPSNRPSDRPQD